MRAEGRSRTWFLYAAYYAAAIAIGIVVGLVVVAFAGGNVGLALSTILTGPLTTAAGVQQIFVRFIILCLIGLGVGLALKAGLWNVGGQGQMIIGMVMVFVVFTYMHLTAPLLFSVIILSAALGGLAWMIVPVVLKTKLGANEIVVTLLLNIVASNLGLYLINGPIRGPVSFGYPITATLPDDLRIPLTLAVPLVVVVGVALYFLVERTSFNLEANTVGKSIVTANYAGVSVNNVMAITMLAAGALAGLSGAFLVMGYLYHLDAGQFSTNYGLLAIIVALLGRRSMLGITLASLLFAYVTIGVEEMAVVTGVQSSVEFAIEGIMLITVLFASYLIDRSRKV